MTTEPVSTSTPSTPVPAAGAAPASPVSPAPDPQARPKGRHTAFHRSSYTALPGSPVTADTRPEDLEFPRESRAYALFFYTLCFIASRSAYGADIVVLSVPEIASMARHSRRWVYKALNYLSYHGFVFLIPTPAYVVGAKLDRVVCLRVPSPGSRPVAPYVDPDARPISSADALWLGKPNPRQPRDPAPHLVPLATVKVPSRAVLAKATRRAKAAARPDLSILDAVPPNDEAAFCRVVSKAVAERFGSVRAIPVARARLPVPHRIFDPDFELKDDVNCPGPYTIERAADSAGRRSFVRQLERVFNVRSRRPVHDGWELEEGQTPLSLLFQALPRYQRARFNVEAFVQACQQHVLVDGAGHPDFPGYHALNGCFHGPPNVCRCPLPARTGVGAVPMQRLDPAQADHAARAVPHVFNRKT